MKLRLTFVEGYDARALGIGRPEVLASRSWSQCQDSPPLAGNRKITPRAPQDLPYLSKKKRDSGIEKQ